MENTSNTQGTKPPLTKSGFLEFLQCEKSFWLQHKSPDEHPAPTPSSFDQLLMQNGYAIEKLARKMFANGKGGEEFDFQLIFQINGCLAKADAVRRLVDGRIEIYEVKSSTSAKDHIQDAAFQRIIAERMGHDVAASFIVHVDKEYRLDGDIDTPMLLTTICVDGEIAEIRQEIEASIDKALALLSLDEIDQQGCDCMLKSKGNRCPSFDYLNKDIPEPSAYDLPRMHGARLTKLVGEGRLAICDIADDDVTPSQLPVLAALRSGEAIVNEDALKTFFGDLAFPLHFYDYESAGGAIPLGQGHGPHEQNPTQFSCHVMQEDGEMDHFAFLADAHGQEAELVDSLKQCIANEGSLLVWNETFEKGCNRRMMRLRPSDVPFLQSMNDRTVDLMKPFKAHYVHPDFRGSTSIKKVLPVLCPELAYDEDAVHDGTGAILAFREMVGTENPTERAELRRQLLAYCKLDTEAMVAIYAKLRKVIA